MPDNVVTFFKKQRVRLLAIYLYLNILYVVTDRNAKTYAISLIIRKY